MIEDGVNLNGIGHRFGPFNEENNIFTDWGMVKPTMGLRSTINSFEFKSEPKTWRGKTQTEVQVFKQDFIERL